MGIKGKAETAAELTKPHSEKKVLIKNQNWIKVEI